MVGSVAKIEGLEQSLSQLQSDRMVQLLASIQSGALNMPPYSPATTQVSPLSSFGRNVQGNSIREPASTLLLPMRPAALSNSTYNTFLPLRLPVPSYNTVSISREAQLELINNAAKQIQAELVVEKYKEEYTKILQKFARTGGLNQPLASSMETQDSAESSTQTAASDFKKSKNSLLKAQRSERKSKAKSYRDISKRKTFPRVLYEMLQEQHNNISSDQSLAWLPDGTGFIIHNKGEFEKVLLQKHFKGIKFRSFQRQLNIYGFERLEECEAHSYKHRCFVRDQVDLMNNIKRVPIKKMNLPKV